MKKYELLKEDSIQDTNQSHQMQTLYHIKYLINVPNTSIKAGDLGGYLSGEHNLSHEGSCAVEDDAKIFDNAQVLGNARVQHKARMFENAIICDNAKLDGWSEICDTSIVKGNATVFGNVTVCDKATISGGQIFD